MERVRPLKLEAPDSGGQELDEFPTSLDPNEDVIDCHGIALQSAESNDVLATITRDDSGNIVFVDVNTPQRTLSQLAYGTGMSPEDHRLLSQLTHLLDRDYYEEYIYSGNLVQQIVIWDSPEKNYKVREELYTYNGPRVVSVTIKQYNSFGVEVERLVEVYNYSGSRVVSVTVTRSVP